MRGRDDPVPVLILPRSRRARRLIGASASLIVAAAALYTFIELGRILAREDPLERSDAIFVFAGTVVERPLEAVDLFRAGYAPRIVITRATAEHAIAEVERRGITVPTEFDVTHDVLRGLDIPESAIVAPDRIHDNTGEEARTLRALAMQFGWRRITVVSSKYHLRRASIACRRALRGTGVEVRMRASRYDESNPDRWWSRRSDIRWMASEVPKLLAYALSIGT